MKLFLCLCLFSFIAATLSEEESRGCFRIMGTCKEDCPVGTKEYNSACGYFQPEATCKYPNPPLDTSGKRCDYSACYCVAPTVRDEKTGKCVKLEDCS